MPNFFRLFFVPFSGNLPPFSLAFICLFVHALSRLPTLVPSSGRRARACRTRCPPRCCPSKHTSSARQSRKCAPWPTTKRRRRTRATTGSCRARCAPSSTTRSCPRLLSSVTSSTVRSARTPQRASATRTDDDDADTGGAARERGAFAEQWAAMTYRSRTTVTNRHPFALQRAHGA
jgi:hypothetical protein